MTNPNTLYSRKRTRAIAYGTWEPSVIPAGHVIAHLRDLSESGRSARWIARASQVSECTVTRLLSGKAKRVARHNAVKLLALTHAVKPTGKTWVPGAGAKRRVEALGTLGHPQSAIAEEAGLSQGVVSNVVTRPERVAADTHNAIAAAYERLVVRERSDAVGRWVKARADRLGFAPPEAWSRYTIDVPGARPMTSRTAQTAAA